MRSCARSWAFLLVLWLGFCSGTQARTLEISQAQMQLETLGEAQEKQVQLPYFWDHHYPGYAGTAKFSLRWALADVPAEEGVAIYLPRVGNRFELSVNGHVLLTHLSTEAMRVSQKQADFSKRPHWVAVPEAVLKAENVLHLRVESDVLRKGGLNPVVVGSAQELYERYERDYRWQVGWALVMVAFNWTVAGFSLILWSTESEVRPREPLYLIAALTEFFWSIRMLDVVLITPPWPWPWWSFLVYAAYIFWIYGALMFVHLIVDIQGQRIQRTSFVVMLIGVATAAMEAFAGIDMPRVIWLGCVAVSLLVYGVWFCHRALRQPNAERVLIALAVIVNVVLGVHDWWFVRVLGGVNGHTNWMPYSVVLFGGSLVFVVISRFRQSMLRERAATSQFEFRVKEKEMVLRQDYEDQKLHLAENERLTERQRVLRDMHDGVGAHLSAAIRQIERGSIKPADLTWTLHDCLDLLKLTVDGMNCEMGDVVGLLANIRYRLDARMRAAGLQLVWRIDAEVQKINWMTMQNMQNLRFMIFGIFSNILQHADATQLEVSLHLDGPLCVFDFSDNGVGFNVDQTSFRGLRFLHERAQLLGGVLQIQSQTGQTRVTLRLPLKK
mgnify:FL=1